MNIFDNKLVIVLDQEQSKGQLANRAAVLTTGITKLYPEIVGSDLVTGDNMTLSAITQLPIPVLARKEHISFLEISHHVIEKGCTLIMYLAEAQGLRSYTEYKELIAGKEFNSLNIDGILIFGPKKEVNSITGSFGMLK